MEQKARRAVVVKGLGGSGTGGTSGGAVVDGGSVVATHVCC